MQVMADEFWREFYGKNFKGGQSTLYLGDRFWNVKMDALSDGCVFTHGCSKMIKDLALDRRSTFVFSLHGNKIFELSVFNHLTGTQIQNNSVELVVLDDSIYGDDVDDFLIAVLLWNVKTTNFGWQVLNLCSMILMIPSLITFFHLNLKIEDLKKKFKDDWDTKTESQGKTSVVCDEDLTIKVLFILKIILLCT
ncbi:putative transcription factor B3-Domain family [Helianthus annuus]|nr:putative transcription factor B3-Domain family [Helianthus annuus]KAJ0774801.1 putative transcription factor B3-Domain family [Helianthus annuus]